MNFECRYEILNRVMKKLLLIFILIYFSMGSVFAASFRKVSVQPVLKKRIKQILEMAKDLHEFTYTSNKIKTRLLLEKLELQINETKKIIVKDGPGADYLLKLFDEMNGSFIKAKDLEKQEQKDVLKLGFEKVVRITQGFDVGNYRTFYCQTYKDLWIQRSWVVQNPVHPKSRCGVLVN